MFIKYNLIEFIKNVYKIFSKFNQNRTVFQETSHLPWAAPAAFYDLREGGFH